MHRQQQHLAPYTAPYLFWSGFWYSTRKLSWNRGRKWQGVSGMQLSFSGQVFAGPGGNNIGPRTTASVYWDVFAIRQGPVIRSLGKLLLIRALGEFSICFATLSH